MAKILRAPNITEMVMMVWPCESDMLAVFFPANAMLKSCGSQDRSRVSEDATLDDDGTRNGLVEVMYFRGEN